MIKRKSVASKNKSITTQNDSGRNQSGLRAYNERRILSLIRSQKSASKAEIAQRTGLSAQAVTVIIKSLEKESLLTKLPPKRGKVGQPSVPFALNPEGAYGIGLKIGRRSYDLTLIDFCGNVRATLRENFAYPRVDQLLAFMKKGLKSITYSLDIEQIQRISGVGVATPYEIWNWAEEADAPKDVLAEWKTFDFSKQIQAVFHLPVYVCNDDTAACSAELSYGNPEKFSDFLYIFIGTFVGGAIVLNDILFTGKRGNAGAIGSLPKFNVSKDGTLTHDQLIMQCSIYILEKMLAEAGVDTTLLFKSAAQWDDLGPTLNTWIDQVSEGLAYAALTSIAILDIEGIVIDGALPESIKMKIVEATQQKLQASDFRGLNRCDVTSGAIGLKAQSIGSATLPLLANFSHNSEQLFS